MEDVFLAPLAMDRDRLVKYFLRYYAAGEALSASLIFRVFFHEIHISLSRQIYARV